MLKKNEIIHSKMVEIDERKMVSMSNSSIEDRLLENYGVYGIKIVMIGVVGAYAMDSKNYDHRQFIKFSVENFAKLIGKEEKYAISIFKRTCALLRSKEIIIPGFLDDKPYNFVTGILNTFAYSHDEKSLAVKFEEAFVPHFMEMKGNFTQHELGYIMNLERVNTITFYRFLKMKIGKEFKNMIAGKEYYLEIQEITLRQFFEAENKYSQSRDFRNKVLVKYADEINLGTDLNISFEQSIQAGYFTITLSKKAKEDDPIKISLDAFRLTKQKKVRAKKPKQVEKKAANELPVSTGSKAPEGDSTKENGTGAPQHVGEVFNQRPKAPKAPAPEIMDKEELLALVNMFIRTNDKIYSILTNMFDKGLIAPYKTPYDYLYFVFGQYQQKVGSVELKNLVSNKVHLLESSLSEYLNQDKRVGFQLIKDLLEEVEV